MSILEKNDLFRFLFIILLTVLACTKVTLQGKVSRRYIRTTQDSVLYNVLFFTAISASLAILFPLAAPTCDVLLLALLSGICNATFQITYSVALNEGPVSLTVLMASFSILLPTSLSVFLFRENLYYTQFVGVLLLGASMVLNVGHGKNEKKVSAKWLILSVVATLCSGFSSCIQKFFYLTDGSKVENFANTYLFFVYVFSSVLGFAMYLYESHFDKKERSTFWFNKYVLFYAIGIGAVLAVFQKLYMLGIEHIPGTVMFPTYAGMQSLAMTIIGIVLFKDHLSARQKIGVLCGVASVALINLKIGGYLL